MVSKEKEIYKFLRSKLYEFYHREFRVNEKEDGVLCQLSKYSGDIPKDGYDVLEVYGKLWIHIPGRKVKAKLFEEILLNPNRLTLITIANVARYYWCAIESLFRSKETEFGYREATKIKNGVTLRDYFLSIRRTEELRKEIESEEIIIKKELKEKLSYHTVDFINPETGKRVKLKLGNLPGKYTDFVNPKTGKPMRLINPHLPDKKIKYFEERAKSKGIGIANIKDYPILPNPKTGKREQVRLINLPGKYISFVNSKTDEPVRLINPRLPDKEIKYFEEEAKSKGIGIANVKDTANVESYERDYPIPRARLMEELNMEKYPTPWGSFDWHDYTVIGKPDGITKDFVYEFKSVRNRFLFFYTKPVALTQADLYGYFFKRKRKRVQIHILEEDKIETWDEPVDKKNAINTLTYFEEIDKGIPPKPPKKWKCKKCEFIKTCPLLKK